MIIKSLERKNNNGESTCVTCDACDEVEIILYVAKTNVTIITAILNNESTSHISYSSHRSENPVISIGVMNNSFKLLSSLAKISRNRLI
jgi:hypothetical protein